MKILKLLNRKYLTIILLTILIGLNSNAEDEPVDIWNTDETKLKEISNNVDVNNEITQNSEFTESDIFNMQSEKETSLVKVDNVLDSNELKIIGLYDPEDHGLKIDMWSSSNGDQLKYLFSNLAKLDLSKDAAELMNILLLTNAYYPNSNITKKEFLKIKSDWLIKNNDLNLIENYLVNNQILDLHPKLSRHLVDHYLSSSNLTKACDIFSKNTQRITDICGNLARILSNDTDIAALQTTSSGNTTAINNSNIAINSNTLNITSNDSDALPPYFSG